MTVAVRLHPRKGKARQPLRRGATPDRPPPPRDRRCSRPVIQGRSATGGNVLALCARTDGAARRPDHRPVTPHPPPGAAGPAPRGASRSCWRILCTADFPACCLAGFPTRRPFAKLARPPDLIHSIGMHGHLRSRPPAALQPVGGLVPGQFLFELAQPGVGVDDHAFRRRPWRAKSSSISVVTAWLKPVWCAPPA